jgi:mono/diheme cytochrome c family protein
MSAAPASSAASSGVAAAPGSSAMTSAPAVKLDPKLQRPSSPGDPGPALALKGDPTSGAALYDKKCKKCHGDEGKGGVENKGSDDKTIPALHPLAADMISKDRGAMLANLDLYMEHGSSPKGPSPDRDMPAFGEMKKLQPQEIADLLALIMSWNP